MTSRSSFSRYSIFSFVWLIVPKTLNENPPFLFQLRYDYFFCHNQLFAPKEYKMGMKQSKGSVTITNTPKKGEVITKDSNGTVEPEKIEDKTTVANGEANTEVGPDGDGKVTETNGDIKKEDDEKKDEESKDETKEEDENKENADDTKGAADVTLEDEADKSTGKTIL